MAAAKVILERMGDNDKAMLFLVIGAQKLFRRKAAETVTQ